MEDVSGKGSTSVRKYTERAKPAVITVGGQSVLVGGRWNDRAMADYVLENGVNEWLTIGHLAKVGCGSNTIATKKRVRSRLSPLFMELRSRGHFLAIEYDGGHGAAMSVKIADLTSEQDRQNVSDKLKRMKARKELSEKEYEKSVTLLYALIRCG